ncbi:hypothetical protein [Pseudonocardia sp. ICBG1293]|uniref:hypothetical protein n=1 Tax=Pseudonocardia sp. ICBG1293 TaxID=2844382 RepID=UPI001CCE54C6|nr:hypothetical protein [Pseudonocardia sp. ICBG1293]
MAVAVAVVAGAAGCGTGSTTLSGARAVSGAAKPVPYGHESTVDALTVTASELQKHDALSAVQACSVVAVKNNRDDVVQFDPFDWKFTGDDGVDVLAGHSLGGHVNDLGYGNLAPGETASGAVCSDPMVDAAEVTGVQYEPLFGASPPVTWTG